MSRDGVQRDQSSNGSDCCVKTVCDVSAAGDGFPPDRGRVVRLRRERLTGVACSGEALRSSNSGSDTRPPRIASIAIRGIRIDRPNRTAGMPSAPSESMNRFANLYAELRLTRSTRAASLTLRKSGSVGASAAADAGLRNTFT